MRCAPGYDMEQVDAFLDAIRDTFSGVRQPPLTAEDIRTKKFATTRLRPGYDQEEVDAFLDEAEARLRIRSAERGAETAEATPHCVRCGAPAVERPSLVAGGPGVSPARAPSGSPRFSTTHLRPGYDMEQVDTFLDAVRDTFSGVRQPPLTAEDIRT